MVGAHLSSLEFVKVGTALWRRRFLILQATWPSKAKKYKSREGRLSGGSRAEAGGVGSRNIVMSRKRYILAIRRKGRQVRAQLRRDWQLSEYNLLKIDWTTSTGNFRDQFDDILGDEGCP